MTSKAPETKRRKLTVFERQLLAAMKASLALADRNLSRFYSGRTPQCQKIYDRCAALVKKGEALKP